MKTISLNGIWSLSGRPESFPEVPTIKLDATVPGCVQLDLSAAGYLPADLNMGRNICEAEKYEGYEWWYTRKFTAPEERKNVFLVFEGVDCVAEYFLNDVKFGESENMFIAHEFDISSLLCDGENTLTVHIKSPVIYANSFDIPAKHYLNWGNDAANTNIRRAPHSYGWDIMPRAVTSGLWREVRLEVRDKIYFSQLYAYPRSNSCQLLCELKCDWSELGDIVLIAEGACGADSRFYAERTIPRDHRKGRTAQFALNFENPKQWMPYGYGEPNVYDGTVKIYQSGELIHTAPISFGLRTVVLDRTDTTDGENGRFRFLINGIEIMAKGSNWVPMDAFHCRDRERYAAALALVKDIGCNILRCWGGNVYEDHAFFDFCDRNGIMVWQDFAMACASYPQDDRFRRLIKEEASALVRKLRNHPSIILWAGDNEIDSLNCGYGFAPEANKITREWLPEEVAQNDPSRPYLASSPYIATLKDNGRSPENHLWGPRDYFKSDFYSQSKAHFVSETGYHGCPSLESIKKFITPEKVWPYINNDEWILHSCDQGDWDYRVMLMEKQVAQLFGEVPTKPEEYILASQISQAEAKKYFIERIRVGRPKKTGIIWWNLIDGWPEMSDAVVDYYYEKKLAYNYIKRSQAPFAIIVDEMKNWNHSIYACNDTLGDISGKVRIKDCETDDVLLECDFNAAANTSTAIAKIPMFYSEQRFLIIDWEAGEHSGKNHYLCGYPAISFERYKSFLNKYLSEE